MLSRSISVRRRNQTVQRCHVRSQPPVTMRWICSPWWKALRTCFRWTLAGLSCTRACRSTCRPGRTPPCRAVSEKGTKSTWLWGWDTSLALTTVNKAPWRSVSPQLLNTVISLNELLVLWKHNFLYELLVKSCWLFCHFNNLYLSLKNTSLTYYFFIQVIFMMYFQKRNILEYICTLPPMDIIDVIYCMPNVPDV